MSPSGIVTGEIATTHPGSCAANVTLIPPAGAGIGAPLLSSRTVSVAPKVSLIVTVKFCRMSRFAVVETADCALPKSTVVPVTVAVPGATPDRMALVVCDPSAIVTIGVSTAAAAGLSLTRVTTTPPAGASEEICTGSDAVPPNGTLSVAGRASTCTDTSTGSTPSA